MKTQARFAALLAVCTGAGLLALLCAPGIIRAQTPAVGSAAPAAGAAPDASTARPAIAAAASAQDPLVQRGAYLARAGDCIACHTAPKGKPFAGGLPMATPFGTVYSSNITPDKTTGIGDYSLADFDKALRQGVAKHTGHLYPAMPYPSFRFMSQADVKALYAYFMQGVAPVKQANRASHLQFPFNVRALMIGWNLLYLKGKAPYQNDASHSVEWNRGAYLVQGLGHCGACHTPHGVTGQEKAFNERGGSQYLGGATLAGWNAPMLTGDLASGLAGWSKADIVAFLKTGHTAQTAAFGAMTEVVNDSTQYLSDTDLNAMAEYLKSLPVQGEKSAAGQVGGPAPGQPATSLAAATLALRSGNVGARGALLYVNNCAACHGSDGAGAQQAFPALSGNPVVNSPDPTSLIHIVLSGSRRPSTTASPAPLAMPDFAWRLDDRQVADVLTFIRSSWGNHGTSIEAGAVAKIRKQVSARSPASRPVAGS